ncbi:MAG: PD-(D/E)XK nuclease-like domain-containing protein [Magnetococcales bacterium]|nr:PD-(D/E)XK nuclease-like domain-containing protein [Magnetococcales bacterium]
MTIPSRNQELSVTPTGVYLNLPAEKYHADPSLSASGIKAMGASPQTYWYQFFDPNRVDESDTPAKVLGRAIHKMVLEGDEAFHIAYAVEPHPQDYPGCLQGVDALRTKCEELGLKKSGTLEEMSNRILDIDPECILWPVIKSRFQASMVGSDKEVISGETYKQSQRASKAINANDSARSAFMGGLPEVSVFWKTSDGVPMKSRFDYLKPHALVDLKTFSNSNGIPVDSAVVHAVTKYQYSIQAYVYLQAAAAAKQLIQNGCVYGDDSNALQQFARVKDDPRFFFVFLETGPAMNVLVREFTQSQANLMSLVWEKGKRTSERAIQVWANCMNNFGPNQPWIMNQPVRPFMDEEFPLWAV